MYRLGVGAAPQGCLRPLSPAMSHESRRTDGARSRGRLISELVEVVSPGAFIVRGKRLEIV